MNAGSIIATLRLRTEEFRRGLDEARNGLNRVSGDLKKVGAAAAAFGGTIAMGLGSAVKTAANFEQGMSRVGAVSGANAEQMEALTEKAKELGASTSFSASQAAEGMQYLAMAGFETKDIISAMPGVLDMAAAGAVNLGDAANIASNIMSGFGLEAFKTGQVADVLAKTFTSSNTTLHSLGETMKYVAPAAKSVGWTLEEMAAATGKLGDVGIDASMAGTALRSAVVRLAAPTKDAKGVLNEFGIKLQDANGKMLPLAKILEQMKAKFAGLTDAEKSAAVQTIFGTEAMSAMLALMEDPKGLQTFTQELENAGGTAGKVADKQLDNLNGALTILNSGVEAAKIALGDALVPALKTVAQALQKGVTWFNGLSDSTKHTIAIAAALTAGLTVLGGGLLIIIGFIPSIVAGFGSVITVVKSLTTVVGLFGRALMFLVANPFGLVIVGIAGLIVAIVMIIKHWDWVKSSTITVWNAIKGFLSATWGAIKVGLSSAIASIKSIAYGGSSYLKQTFWAAVSSVKNAFSSMYNTVIGKLNSLISGIKGKVLRAKAWLSELNPFKRHSPSLVDNVLAGVKKIKETYRSVSDMEIKPPAVGAISSGRLNVSGMLEGGEKGSGEGSVNYNAPLVAVQNMSVRNDQDIRSISSELYNLQRHADRSRGR